MISEEEITIVEHFVLLKLKDGTGQEQIGSMTDNLKALVSKIPGLLSVSAGKIFVEDWMPDRTKGYNFGIYARLSSKDALHTYQDHESHLKVKKEDILPIVEGPILAVDWMSKTTEAISEEEQTKEKDESAEVNHLVLIKTRDGTTGDQISQMITQVESLSSLDCVSSISAGEVFVEEEWMMDRTLGMTVGLRVGLKSKEDLLCYAEHERHVKVRDDYIVPIASGVLAADW